MTEYRPLTDDEAATFHEFVTYAFRPQAGPESMEYDPEEADERDRLGVKRGLFADDGEPLAVCRHYWFETSLRGATVEMPGLSAVASPPEHRRGGNVRRMLEASVEEYHERGAPICTLWPFEYGFYRQYGWETANRYVDISCPPAALAFAAEAADAAAERAGRTAEDTRWRRLDADDWAEADAVYRADTAGMDLTVDRDEDWWRHRRFTGWEDDPFVYGWGTDDELRAYVIYEVNEGEDGRELDVWEHRARDHEAYLRCLAFCRDHDSQVSTVTLHEQRGTDLPDLVDDRDDLDVELQGGPMVRIVDVADALETVAYGADGTVTVDVSDGLAPWNDDTFSVDVSAGSGTVHRVEGDADAELDVGALTQLLVGYAPAGSLAKTTDLTADDETLATLDRLFPENDAAVLDFF
ncbi:GNAT family N-acetyltransferase [Haloarchaeobius iranensis]|uniref:Predicted acetyltransferase n=1 Tax=Haloarchaeobius iranensis TaxID=996166 RepID=A0A1G9WDI7_9EURY|nr:GNAT family N-acetyltransferase [Haloarchaeobius iranensis]SDM82578.1 Predicted acetyltransferase [Haloarchaeobius iranensis]